MYIIILNGTNEFLYYYVNKVLRPYFPQCFAELYFKCVITLLTYNKYSSTNLSLSRL